MSEEKKLKDKIIEDIYKLNVNGLIASKKDFRDGIVEGVNHMFDILLITHGKHELQKTLENE